MSATSESLQREREARRWAVPLTAAAALLLLAGAIENPAPQSRSGYEQTYQLLFYNAHRDRLILSTALICLGSLCLVGTLRYLYIAVKARRPGLPPVAGVLGAIGPVVYGVGQLVSAILLSQHAHHFATHGAQGWFEYKHEIGAAPLLAAGIAQQAAALALLFAFSMLSLNGMRVGLLTRFMGYVGIATGVFFVLPIIPGAAVIQAMWLGAAAYLFSGRWPSEVPAWKTGRAEPWPSSAEMRERRQSGLGNTPATEAAVPAPRGATAGAKKRKRKKRR